MTMLGRPLKVEDADLAAIVYWHSIHWSTRRIARELQGRYSHQTIWRTIRRFGSQRFLERVLERKRQAGQPHVPKTVPKANTRDLGEEIDHYQPALNSSFNKGLGTVTPPSMIHRAIKASNPPGDYIEFRKRKWDLLSRLSEMKLDPIANRFREIVKKRVTTLGFDAGSDNDVQFGQFNDMASVGLAVIKMAGEQASKLNLSRLADAAIIYRRPDWRQRLQESRSQLRCGRCRKVRSFIWSRNAQSVICLTCGREEPKEKARIRTVLRKIDPEYVDLIHSVVTSKSRGSGSESGPLTSPREARKHIEECGNVSNDQDSK